MSNFVLGAKRPLIISGPCSAESREQLLETCTAIAASGKVDVLRAGIWKPRTQPGSFEGMGVKALPWLAEVKQLTGLPVAVEVANAKHVEECLEFGVDILWIGARTTVSPFAMQELAEAIRGKDVSVLIKNPVNPDVALWEGAVKRFCNVGFPEERIGLILRGFSYVGHNKYRNPPMWDLALEMRSRFPKMMMLCDSSHICGCRDYLQDISQTAADLCFDGLMLESHCNPDVALSDAKQQLRPADLAQMLDGITWRHQESDDAEFLDRLEFYRRQIDQFDSEIFDLLSRRMNICEKIGELKKQSAVSILQVARKDKIRNRLLAQADALNLSQEFLASVFEAIHLESITRQNKVMNK